MVVTCLSLMVIYSILGWAKILGQLMGLLLVIHWFICGVSEKYKCVYCDSLKNYSHFIDHIA